MFFPLCKNRQFFTPFYFVVLFITEITQTDNSSCLSPFISSFSFCGDLNLNYSLNHNLRSKLEKGKSCISFIFDFFFFLMETTLFID